MPSPSDAEYVAAANKFVEWAKENPDVIETLFGGRYASVVSAQEAIDCGLNWFGAELLAESFHRIQKDRPEVDRLEVVDLVVESNKPDMPVYYVAVARFGVVSRMGLARAIDAVNLKHMHEAETAMTALEKHGRETLTEALKKVFP